MLYKTCNNDATAKGTSFWKTLLMAKHAVALANNNLFAAFYGITPRKCTESDLTPKLVVKPSSSLVKAVMTPGSCMWSACPSTLP
jgi:hypothetical protein